MTSRNFFNKFRLIVFRDYEYKRPSKFIFQKKKEAEDLVREQREFEEEEIMKEKRKEEAKRIAEKEEERKKVE